MQVLGADIRLKNLDDISDLYDIQKEETGFIFVFDILISAILDLSHKIEREKLTLLSVSSN